MATETLRTVGRSRFLLNIIHIERWIQKNGGVEVIFGESGDMNRIDAVSDAQTADGWWFHAPSLDESGWDPTDTWFGQLITVKFKSPGLASGQWHTVYAKIKEFVETAFPGEVIFEGNMKVTRPVPGDAVTNPSRFVCWLLEGE